MRTHSQSTLRTTSRAVIRNAAVPIAILTACCWIIWLRLEDLDFASLALSLASISPGAWIIAICATMASFLAVARYDAVFHGWLATGVSSSRAALSGAASIALSQFLGFGLVTGTLCRWRMLPDVTFSDAAKVTGYVSAAFMISLGLLTLVALDLSGLMAQAAGRLVLLAALAFGVLCYISIRQPEWLPFKLPPIPLMLRVVVTTFVDVFFAALVFWILLPTDHGVPYMLLFSVFLLGLCTGLVSSTPFGLGPFEVCFLTLLPQIPTADLFAAILGFRLVFFAIPACLAVLVLARPPASTQTCISGHPPSLASNFAAEAGFADLSEDHNLAHLGCSTFVTARASQSIVALGDPVCGQLNDDYFLSDFRQRAKELQKLPMVYKCSARLAVSARQQRWRVAAVSEEAWICPQEFDMDIPARRQLRRKLRRANRANVGIINTSALPLDTMAEIACSWSGRRGGERGFSMGRFSPCYVARQNVFLAFIDEQLIAFATFHTSQTNWTLDLIRSRSSVPDGTMHALIFAAVQEAKLAGVKRISLSAMPLIDGSPLSRIATRISGAGLRQFKCSFAPRTRRLYAAAPTRLALILGGIDILLRIRFPKPHRSQKYSHRASASDAIIRAQ